jgi:hypothetical protein
MVLMRENKRTGSSLITYSRDEGNTWSEIEETIPYLIYPGRPSCGNIQRQDDWQPVLWAFCRLGWKV